MVTSSRLRLDDLIHMAEPLESTIETVRSMPMSDTAVQMTADHAKAAVMRYLREQVTFTRLRQWARVVLGRRDVTLEPNYENELLEMLEEIAFSSETAFGVDEAEVWISRFDWS